VLREGEREEESNPRNKVINTIFLRKSIISSLTARLFYGLRLKRSEKKEARSIRKQLKPLSTHKTSTTKETF
jgi:hypothetical protein